MTTAVSSFVQPPYFFLALLWIKYMNNVGLMKQNILGPVTPNSVNLKDDTQ